MVELFLIVSDLTKDSKGLNIEDKELCLFWSLKALEERSNIWKPFSGIIRLYILATVAVPDIEFFVYIPLLLFITLLELFYSGELGFKVADVVLVVVTIATGTIEVTYFEFGRLKFWDAKLLLELNFESDNELRLRFGKAVDWDCMDLLG